jgi:hypothetical protein
MPDPVIPETERGFKPPERIPAHFTGTLWKNKDGTLGATITDVFLWPIHIVATREGDCYHLRGWRGKPPEAIRIPLIDEPETAHGTE